jgi:hypothetical protein
MGRPSKEKSSAELPTINKTDTRKELAKFYIANVQHMIDGTDYFKVCANEIRTHKTFWAFGFNATTPIFHKWCLQKREYML